MYSINKVFQNEEVNIISVCNEKKEDKNKT